MSLTATRQSFPGNSLLAVAGWLAALTGWRRLAVSFLLGAVSVAAFAPFHLWPLLFFTFPAFVWVLDGIAAATPRPAPKPRWRQAALAGWAFGFGFFLLGLYWIGFAFLVEAEKFAVLMPLAVAALPAGLALFYAASAAAAVTLWRPGAGRIFIFVSAFFAAEWLRGHILTGFPWNLWGYALAGSEQIAQTTSIFGIYGLTLAGLLIVASPAALAGPGLRSERRHWMLPAICLGLLTVAWLWGAWRLSGPLTGSQADTRLRIVQANIPQADKWKPENRQWIFDRLLTLSRNGPEGAAADTAPITHLIWPETSVPFLFMLNDTMPVADARETFADLIGPGTTFIVGAERIEGTKRPDGRYSVDRAFNSLFVLDDEARVVSIYDKLHLVPFGEYLPFEETLGALGITKLVHTNAGFASGAARRPMPTPKASAFVPLICYEAVFPGRAVGDEGRPGWLLNLTNDAWFGTSTGPYQHLHQSRIRAVEQGLPLIRAANTGISAVVDSYGRVLASLPLNSIGVIDHALPVALSPTLYAAWGESWLFLVAFLIFLLYRIVIVVE